MPRRMIKKAVSKAAADGSTGGVALGYVEDAFEARTLLAAFFSILLCGEKLFGVGRRQPTELSAVAGAIQDRHL